ncbi:hypothetical protein MMC18_006295 [Xylographa bjoerkii]|nr:hypothetical protein [Xylographa bjoerkii]
MAGSASHTESAFTFIPRGAAIQEFNVAGHNIVQNFPEAALYDLVPHPHFGETVGRTTNRIKGAVLHNLNSKTYHLNANNGEHSLHGGPTGWGKRTWEGPQKVERRGKEGVFFRYVSKDGEEGFPGTVEARVWYVAGMEDGKTVLDVEYEVELVGDEVEETVVGVTNHRYDGFLSFAPNSLISYVLWSFFGSSNFPTARILYTDQHPSSYFNLNLPAPTIEGTVCSLGTTLYQEITPDGIPTGKITTYPSLPSTPNKLFRLGATDPDPDDCFIMNSDPASIPLDTRSLPLKIIATMHHPHTGLHLEIESTEPAFQFYCGRFVDVPECKTSQGARVEKRGKRCGICVEPSRYVDAPGREEWRGMCRLRKGELFGSRSVYRAWKD